MASRDRDTYVHRTGVAPETTSIISQKNKIYAISAEDAASIYYQIGVVASFDPSETRTIETVRGVGYGDHVAELVPGVTDPMTLTVQRTAQYLSMIFQVFGYKGGIDGIVRSLRHHKWPFDIVQEVVISSLVANDETYGKNLTEMDANLGSFNNEQFKAIMTYFEGCWMSDYGASYTADAALVQENVTINVTDIVSNAGTIAGSYSEATSDLLFNVNAKSKIIGQTFTPASGGGTTSPPTA